jgi:hypothetical protein
LEDFLRGLGLEDLPTDQRRDLLTHVILGLAREALIDEESWDFVASQGEDNEYRTGHIPQTDHRTSHFIHPLWASSCSCGGSPIMDQTRFLDPSLELVLSEEIPPLESTTIGDKDEEYESRVQELDQLLESDELAELRAGSVALINEMERPGISILP